MAKNTEKQSGGRMYLVAGILFPLIIGLIIAQVVMVNNAKDSVLDESVAADKAIYTIKEELVEVNRDVVMIIGGMGDAQSLITNIHNSFDVIRANMSDFEAIGSHNEIEMKRYRQAKLYILALDEALIDYEKQLLSGTLDMNSARNVYMQELAPFQTTSIEMFNAVVELNQEDSEEMIQQAKVDSSLTLGIIIVLFAIGEIGIIVAARIAKAQREEVSRKERQAAAADIKFQHSQEKINEVAYTNILTGMKNRYGLENDIGEKLETTQFNIAVFDMDNFRSINDIYGYDFGDEYLVQLAEKIKSEFGFFGELYNITGNEFCIIYNREVSDFQAQKYTQDIFNTLSSVYNVANIGIQLTVSAATYHYLAGECMNLSALLVKMDNAIRNVKRSGGNQIIVVSGMQ